ncbi:hypothetical protein PR202_gb27937 [Eleusine coracana subsp. coracana]|uniref:Inhibitor I9 domain-containing protein n=1 Tax=Eleusine coracana subsp. coracana TaxID=191504 RepID=A0AAV5FTA5_ELECO|nr:hypothetical protein PR202_gb27937 [Eleusine coracana subsp. coracana]
MSASLKHWFFFLEPLKRVELFLNNGWQSQVSVVYMGKELQAINDKNDILRLHHQMLASVHEGSLEKAQASHVYTYSSGFQGFAAKLNKEQAMILARNFPANIF